jgi:UDP-N-acetylglucosamine 2-epimerase
LKINRIVVVVGARPTFIQLAPIINELQKIKSEVLVYHTGQHYDKWMSAVFMSQLNIPKPRRNLHSGSGTHAQQTSVILKRCELYLKKDKPDIVVVGGDTSSAFASALAAAKLKIPIVDIEAGCRTYDKTLPEEVNRVLITHLSSLHFPPTIQCKNNLLKEGISLKNIHLRGHPIVDSVNIVRDKITKTENLKKFSIESGNYYYVTLHRDFNTDNQKRLKLILTELCKIAKKKKIVFPIHPRTKKSINKYGLSKYLKNIISVSPVDYITSLSLVKNSYAIISDSGGLNKEASIFGIPYISLRPNTEWTETLYGQANQLAFHKGNSIMKCVNNLDKNYGKIKQKSRSLQRLFGKPGLSTNIAKDICNWNGQ